MVRTPVFKTQRQGLNLYNYDVGACKADILFVVDNSGSMYEDQVELATRFPKFLEAINNLDYNIAITTTDVSSSPITTILMMWT